MTKEEIIAYGKDYYRDLTTACCEIDEKHKEFVRMAIQALEKENIYDDKEHYVTISKALYDKLNIDYEQTLSQEPCEKCDYVEGSPFCLQYCPYDAEKKKEQEPCDDIYRKAWLELDRLIGKASKSNLSKNMVESDSAILKRIRYLFWEVSRVLFCETYYEYEPFCKEPCDDAISREAVKEIINDIRDCISVEGYCAILERLKKLPPVTQKSGKWIAQDIHNCHTDFRCSECGYIHSFMHLYGEPTADYTYCPNCGAKMESEDKE